MALSPAWPAKVWQLAFSDWLRGSFFLQTGPLSLSEAKVVQEHRTLSPPPSPPTVLASMARKAALPALCAGLHVYNMITEGPFGTLCRSALLSLPAAAVVLDRINARGSLYRLTSASQEYASYAAQRQHTGHGGVQAQLAALLPGGQPMCSKQALGHRVRRESHKEGGGEVARRATTQPN